MRLAITRTARRLRQELAAPLTPSQAAALATIERHGPLAPSELADRERIQRPTVARVVGKLEEQGLVTRVAHPEDRRSTLLAISETGAAVLAEAREEKTAWLAGRLDALDASDRATLLRAAEILEQALESDTDGPR